ncbi:hypothetical protein MTBBW1_80222 [Desulfamplus magnetovallimortis]|uniref:Gp5/Type VI secretion system Vgr protein OB-fold domain-containing protein n=1 Tax=Desulfamplus magnetovallimortis TaxID=1246637 RepID=L0R446_9BACT|nr:type VI secretion system tip protein TssI/VgrG [Desulfamplus magnetovallimortis]CCO06828.1 hypothetical protein DEMABW1_80222 [Desulfamplus magnetovallimortis BW-1]SLM32879.1 hypothetical protein MTBBW1_80222 [Desulfamplus magnetovallimortis]
MEFLTKEKYLFSSKAPNISKEMFGVVSFKGVEGISKTYKFEITLISSMHHTDPLIILENPAIFTILRQEGGNVEFNGILTEFEEIQEFNGYLFYKAVLRPKLWWLRLTHHNQVFLDLNVQEIMESALKDGGLAQGIDFEFRLQKSYDKMEYVCQYDESHFNFVSRWAEREGIYYFFEQTEHGEKVIFTDTRISHRDLLFEKELRYYPRSGLDAVHMDEVIKDFKCSHNLLPSRVYLKDYNYLKPSLVVEGIADVDKNGRGETYLYGEHFDSVEEGNRLASIRAEELFCRKSIFHGEGTVPFITPGYTFNLYDYYNNHYNRKYLICEVTHEGHQTGYLVSGISPEASQQDEEMFYYNRFTAIYSDAQFRPKRKALKPKISGTLNAKVDAASTGKYAEIDDLGRYKVILPFDRSGRFGGKASTWLRMMQPYAGENQGMHFPLHKGTEVLLTFIDGNPDRPLIAGAVPNPETSSPIVSSNQTKSVIQTGKNPVDSSVGAAAYAAYAKGANDHDNENYIEFEDKTGKERIRIHSDGDLWLEAKNRYATYTVKGPNTRANVPTHLKYLWDKFYAASPGFNPTGLRAYSYGTEAVASGGTPTVDTASMKKLAKTGRVQLAKGDTFNTQEGNIYDFGGYWNYNLGNSYVEEHLDQSAELNKTRSSFDLLNTGGPDWTTMNWANAQDSNASKGPSTSDIEIGASGVWDQDTTTGSTSVWVGKKFGRSYDYSEADTIEISKGSSLSIQHGGRHVEIAFRGTTNGGKGAIKSWEWSESGVKKEKKWNSGGTLIYEMTSNETKGVTEETTWNGFTKNKVHFISNNTKSGITTEEQYCKDWEMQMLYSSKKQSIGGVHSFDFSMGWKNSIGINLGATHSLNLELAEKFNMEFTGSLTTKIGIGVAMDFVFYWNPAWELKLKNFQFEFHGPGTKLSKKEDLQAKVQSLLLEDARLHLESKNIDVEKVDFDLLTKQLSIEKSFFMHI